MKTLLIVGVETIVGANLAASCAEQVRVIGLSRGPQLTIGGSESVALECESVEAVRQCLQQTQATHVVFCGFAARSAWETSLAISGESDASAAELWASAAAQAGLHFTQISSDAIFTGPWMFHDEDSSSLCPSPAACAIRDSEARVRAACPKALVVRTNAFGWSPLGAQGGWLEAWLSDLENRRPIDSDPITHATPILASDLADYLLCAWEDALTGVFHIAGAERVNPHQFLHQLALALELPTPTRHSLRELSARPVGFGRGETSLRSNRFRSEYECSMPLLSEGLRRLCEQQDSGYRDRLCQPPLLAGRAA